MPDPSNSSPNSLILKIIGVSGPVSRQLYALTGILLMIGKYSFEVLLIYGFTNEIYSPFAFFVPSFIVRETYFQNAPSWLPWFMILWSIPFSWIALTMSARRAIDIGNSPMFGIMALIPLVNLPFMIVMAALPSTPSRFGQQEVSEESDGNPNNIQPVGNSKSAPIDSQSSMAFVYSAFFGILAGGTLALVATVISAYVVDNYGAALFVAMPIVSGAVSAYIFNQSQMRRISSSIGVGSLSVFLGGCGLLLFAFEGIICLVMAAPLIIPLGAFGGFLGWGLAKTIMLESKWMVGSIALLIVPFTGIIENQTKTSRQFVVESSVIIDAAPDQVWQTVIAFPEIESPPPWYFQLGIASPLRARIEGEGVGAVRHCEFTTGSFVEPITVWDPPNRLAFDVTEQPDPLVELTPYRNVRPPHLQHSFRSVQGEFELRHLPDGKTLLVGRTWYELEMGPVIYWRPWTDEIIHRIHMRVLNHIKDHVEIRDR